MTNEEFDDIEDMDAEEPLTDPECTYNFEEDEDGRADIECEFEVRHGSWWCTTHNCYA